MITYKNVKKIHNGWTTDDLLLGVSRKFRSFVPVSKTFAVKDHTLVQYEAFGREVLVDETNRG